jgi:hypothetical protein
VVVQYFFYFLFLGVLIFLVDWILLKLVGRVLPAANLISGLLAGMVIAWVMESVYRDVTAIWLFPPVVGLCAGLVLAAAFHFDLYSRATFRLFGTLLLALATGILIWLVFFLLSLTGGGRIDVFSRITLIDFLLFAFVVHFGYVFSARIFNTLFPEKSREQPPDAS